MNRSLARKLLDTLTPALDSISFDGTPCAEGPSSQSIVFTMAKKRL